MFILTLRTDNPQAELGLFDDNKKIVYEVWQAHRELAETIHMKIDDLINVKGRTFHKVEGIVVYMGPGSFTGLRIGTSVANALAYALDVPICAADGDKWLENGLKMLITGHDDKQVVPEYGAPVFTTQPRK